MRREVNFKQKNKSVNEYVSRKVDNRKKKMIKMNDLPCMYLIRRECVCVGSFNPIIFQNDFSTLPLRAS